MNPPKFIPDSPDACKEPLEEPIYDDAHEISDDAESDNPENQMVDEDE